MPKKMVELLSWKLMQQNHFTSTTLKRPKEITEMSSSAKLIQMTFRYFIAYENERKLKLSPRFLMQQPLLNSIKTLSITFSTLLPTKPSFTAFLS
jgi:hypothetical protein